MKLVFTDEAKADLLQIGEWIAEDNPPRALTFVDELETRCAGLTAMPVPILWCRATRTAACGAYLTVITSSSIASLPMWSKFFTSYAAHAITNRSCFLTQPRSEAYLEERSPDGTIRSDRPDDKLRASRISPLRGKVGPG
jgi:hypothetical protein